LTVNQRAVSISGFNITRDFNGTTAGPVNFGTLSFNGLASGETASVNTSGVTATYAGPLVGTHAITFSGNFTMTGGNAIPSNYTITQPTGISGVITLASPSAPNPPGEGTVTETSVTLTAPTGGHVLHPHLPVIEYARSAPGGTTPYTTWQTGLSFSGLTASTMYRFFARYGADGTRNNVSPASSGLQVTTSAEPQGTAALTITFAQIVDNAPSIIGPTIYRVSYGGPTTATLIVDNPGQYDSISWQVNNTSITGTGPSFTLSAGNPAYNQIGEHFVTVFVMKGGVPYNKTVSFRVEY
jgi:hypothetical protein